MNDENQTHLPRFTPPGSDPLTKEQVDLIDRLAQISHDRQVQISVHGAGIVNVMPLGGREAPSQWPGPMEVALALAKGLNAIVEALPAKKQAEGVGHVFAHPGLRP